MAQLSLNSGTLSHHLPGMEHQEKPVHRKIHSYQQESGTWSHITEMSWDFTNELNQWCSEEWLSATAQQTQGDNNPQANRLGTQNESHHDQHREKEIESVMILVSGVCVVGASSSSLGSSLRRSQTNSCTWDESAAVWRLHLKPCLVNAPSPVCQLLNRGNRPPLCLLLYNICLTCFVLVLAARLTIHHVAPLGILTICSPDSDHLRSLCLSHCLLHCSGLTGQTSPATRSLTWINHSLHWLIPRSPALDFITNSALPVSWRICVLALDNRVLCVHLRSQFSSEISPDLLYIL